MKVHIGVDSKSGLIHSVETEAANVHALTPVAVLLGGVETEHDADSWAIRESRSETKCKAGGSPSTLPCDLESAECIHKHRRAAWMI